MSEGAHPGPDGTIFALFGATSKLINRLAEVKARIEKRSSGRCLTPISQALTPGRKRESAISNRPHTPAVCAFAGQLRHTRPVSNVEPADEEFLVCYDYGTGGLWGVLTAPSPEAIQQRYPESAIARSSPRWMRRERFEELRAAPLWLDDDPPQGLPAALIADRERD